MKYFTPHLLHNSDEEWELALAAYRKRWTQIKHKFPEEVRRFRSKVCLHDAEFLMVRDLGGILDLVLELDSPALDLVVLSFVLRGKARMKGNLLDAGWLYEEFDVDERGFRFETLLSDGAALSLRFRDFHYWRSAWERSLKRAL